MRSSPHEPDVEPVFKPRFDAMTSAGAKATEPAAPEPLVRVTFDGAPAAGAIALPDGLNRAVLGSTPDIGTALGWAVQAGLQWPAPGQGQTRALWEALATVAAADLTVARVMEPHLDALAILGQARSLDPGIDERLASIGVDQGSTWGVYAAEGPGVRLEATPVAGAPTGEVDLSGRKPWCSLAGTVSHALVTAWVSPTERGLFALDLRSDAVRVRDEAWVPAGLSRVRSTGIDLEGARAVAVGPPGWYLSRPGFAWGGVGVAACWFGGGVGVIRRMVQAAGRREPDQVATMLLGRADIALSGAGARLAQAARSIDDGSLDGHVAAAAALRVRAGVHDAAECVLRSAAHGLGPGPLTAEPEHVERVADLQLYLRQHHAERDEATLGRALLDTAAVPAVWREA